MLTENTVPRILFIHGLESRANGSKTLLLREQGFDVRAHDMDMGVKQITRKNSVIRSAWRLGEVRLALTAMSLGLVTSVKSSSWKMAATTISGAAAWFKWRGETISQQALRQSFDACVAIQEKAVELECPDVIVGSSWGAAVTFELMRKGVWHGPTILLAPAVHRVWERAALGDPDEAARDVNARQTKTIVFHDPTDATVPFGDSEKLCAEAGFELRSVDAGGHRLLGLLHSGVLAETLRVEFAHEKNASS